MFCLPQWDKKSWEFRKIYSTSASVLIDTCLAITRKMALVPAARDSKWREARLRRGLGQNVASIAVSMGVSRATVYRHLRNNVSGATGSTILSRLSSLPLVACTTKAVPFGSLKIFKLFGGSPGIECHETGEGFASLP
ncbi:Hypothetical protein, putative [Bodo saltans]|uniref:Uncharacterized protein n=1 Tax=Bodo saltans TaxID=75058 RepID=A0A0S4J0J1_BODSA|nr:Hypothetical protein, putative [Bodo saltans]|eukprot:CUG40059.1 Hypothetical protein, putative [Bodo saltans]